MSLEKFHLAAEVISPPYLPILMLYQLLLMA